MDSDVVLAFLPGAAQGITTVALGHPLDTAKTRMQALGPRAHRSFTKTIFNMAHVEGVRSLYRGVTPPLVMSAAKRSLQFALWDIFRQQANQNSSSTIYSSSSSVSSSSTIISGVNNNNNNKRGNSYFNRGLEWIGASPFRAGAFAGASGTIIGCPMHVIKIQTQFSTHNITRNAWTCALQIYYREGLMGYFRGFRYHLIKDTFFGSCYLGLYDVSKSWLREMYCVSSSSSSSSYSSYHYWAAKYIYVLGGSPEHFTSQLAFLAGSTSSMLTWILLYPLDTVKTIVQARNIGLKQVLYLFRKEFRVMYRGLGASLVKAGPVCGAAMVVYEFMKSKTEEKQRATLAERKRRSAGAEEFSA